MLKTVSLKLKTTPEQALTLNELQSAYSSACNRLVPVVVENRCWNRVALHKLVYSDLRENTSLGSQMCCNAIFSVCKAYKSQKALKKIKKDVVPVIEFGKTSVHFDKRTYTIKDATLSLYAIDGRIKVEWTTGKRQFSLLESGVPKEAELICRKGKWFFNLVLEFTEAPKVESETAMGVDVGENNLAATSTGKLFGGGELRHRRDKHLSFRGRLQSNGSQSARQTLRQVSGKEQRRVKHTNHEVSKAIVEEAKSIGAGKIILEDLTHIRDNIKGGKRIRTRLHRWAFRQLQIFVEYKAQAVGIAVEYVNPAYTSQTCSLCGSLGVRSKHLFTCSCGFRVHADVNASRNLVRIGCSIELPRADVDQPDVAV
jgi:IS605 OrfB family transposase